MPALRACKSRVQPPGTPTAGVAFVRAWEATGDPMFLDAAVECANALVYGQLESGCWSDRVDFEAGGKKTDVYRNGKGNARGRNYSTLDDDKSQSALRLLIEVDRSLQFRNATIHEAVQYGLDALLKAQFANGGFPQGWRQPVEQLPVVKASYPEYEWRTEGRFKNYWDFATLNDGLAGTVTETLALAFENYHDKRYEAALVRFGDFLIRAQMPEPQPAWAQQYNHQMQPIWARRFEPPAISGRESEDAISTLMFLFETTGQRRFPETIPAALAWLRKSLLADGQIARFYELQSNTPLYFVRDTYALTYDDSRLPTHYSFKSRCKVDKLEERYKQLLSQPAAATKPKSIKSLRKDAEEILSHQDPAGRWVTDKNGRAVTNADEQDPQYALYRKQSVRTEHHQTRRVAAGSQASEGTRLMERG
jgi:PelA/Pel-15E family pectate lyase